jgi:endo-1,4-beta-xylanase
MKLFPAGPVEVDGTARFSLFMNTTAPMPPDVAMPYAVPALPVLPDSAARPASLTATLALGSALVLLGAALMLLGGYRLGVGNQTIQVPFLKWYVDHQLFANDSMVARTIGDYPSFFFQAAAALVRPLGLERTYLLLHVLTTIAFVGACYWLVKTMFNDSLAGLIMILLMITGSHQALGGDPIYSIGFTHTWFVFPVAIIALGLFYREKKLSAFVLAGILFNLHALTAAYLVFMFTLCLLCDLRRVGILRFAVYLMVFGAVAFPTALEMVRQKQVFDAEWIWLTRIRSADHSFPSYWWQTGASDIPRFGLLLGVAILSLSFAAPPDRQRKSLIMGIAVLVLFAIGALCSGDITPRIKPIPTVLRAQLFRSSRLLMILMFAHTAYGLACMLRRPFSRFDPVGGEAQRVDRLSDHEFTELFQRCGRILDVGLAVAVFAAIALPPLLALLPWVLALAVVMAWVNGRLSWLQALTTGGILLLALVAWQRIDFAVPFLPGESAIDFKKGWPTNVTALIALAAGVGIWLVSQIRLRAWANMVFLLEGLLVIGLVGAHEYKPMLDERFRREDPDAQERARWVSAQNWARQNTGPNARFLTPPNQGGFRIHSDRAIVGEWRDGTQAYFNATFAADWWKQMKVLRPNLMYDEKGLFEQNPGRPFRDLLDDELLKMARDNNASYIVVHNTGKGRGLKLAYQNKSWSIYEARSTVPEGVIDRDAWIEQDQFINEVCLPNIEKYRKGDVNIEVADSEGRPLAGAEYEVHQTRQSFGFGASLEFFQPVEGSGADYKPKPVDPRELELFPQVFNYSVIPFSGKWMYIEPVEGTRTFAELDKYVDWCTKHGVEMEYHFLTGLPPAWLRYKSSAVLQDLVQKHMMELVDRYHDRIRVFQVTNDEYYMSYIGPTVKEIRAKYPQLRLGISDCNGFYHMGRDVYSDIYRSLPDIKSLKTAGTPMDFYSSHAHRPYGLWPDARQIYDTMDKFASEGVRFHVSEAVFPLGGRLGGIEESSGSDRRGLPAQILGPLRKGTWTPELQADFAEWFFTVCFSHPACEAVNYWNFGPDSLLGGAGMLDDNYQPKPMFNRLKALIRGKWMTHIAPAPLEEGRVAFRGFHGDYELVVKLPDGRTAKTAFSILPGAPNRYQFKVDTEKGTLTFSGNSPAASRPGR